MTDSNEQSSGRWQRLMRNKMLRSSAVGIVATIIDFTVLEMLVRLLHVDRTLAKIPALALGTATQFVGSRYFAFNAQHGHFGRQMKWFVFVEFCAYWATVGVFHLLTKTLHLPMEIANLASGSIVYFGFSYPIWKRVFAVRPSELDPGAKPPATVAVAPGAEMVSPDPDLASLDRAM